MKVIGLFKSSISFVKGTSGDVFRLARSPREGIKSFYRVSLYRNAGYLMANSGVNAVLGFVFWIIVARFYSTEDVGLGSALISTAGLLSFIGTLGLGFGIIRYLPESQDKSRLLNSSFTLAGLTAIVVGSIFLAGLPLWSPKLIFIRENPVFLATFIIFITIAALNPILNQTFAGFRRAEFALAGGVVFNVLRLTLAAGLAVFLQVFGIFTSWGLAMSISLLLSLFFFLPKVLSRYRPVVSLQKQVTNEMVRFSFANYIGEILINLPSWILPLMVVNFIGPKANAYYYMTWLMTYPLLVISGAISLSLFAEGSYDGMKLAVNLGRSFKLAIILLIPAVSILCLLGDKLLLFFGKQYSVAGGDLIRLLALATIPGSINLLYLGRARAEKKVKEIIFISSTMSFSALALSYLALRYFGIIGIGAAWLTSQIIVAVMILLKFRIGSYLGIKTVKFHGN